MNRRKLEQKIKDERTVCELRVLLLMVSLYAVYYLFASLVILDRGYFTVGGEIFLFIGFTYFSIFFPYNVYAKKRDKYERYIEIYDELMECESTAIMERQENGNYKVFYLRRDRMYVRNIRSDARLLNEDKILEMINLAS